MEKARNKLSLAVEMKVPRRLAKSQGSLLPFLLTSIDVSFGFFPGWLVLQRCKFVF
jgi:hypothetical protein